MALKSFIEVHPSSHFPIQNLPYGVFKPDRGSVARPGVAIGDYVLDLSVIAAAGLFNGPILNNSNCFHEPNLNKLLALDGLLGRKRVLRFRNYSTEPSLRDNESLRHKSLIPLSEVEMVLPIAIGDYTDFFSSLHHAKNCGTIFRGPQNPIPPNWFHLPIAYHGRASSIVISGTDITRPRGQGPPAGNSPPPFGPSVKLDFELEMAAIVGPGNELGKPVDVNAAADHIFGLVLMNDWSGTTISPWIVTLEALEPFSCEAPKQDPHPLPYLAEKISKNYDISLEILDIDSAASTPYYQWLQFKAGRSPWNRDHQRTCMEPESYGCLLELTWNGQKQLSLNGTPRKFLEDGDEVIISGVSKGNGYNIGFGTCSGKIVPSTP
ncbi:fumarylacetoacetase, putative [Prunus dulcis]|uniref:Fumarylacetoacetase n=1 Tax=Prunus dulcis TaxID=3755 RepID=A0A4Y1R8X8_PRUDU|nr:fumarylacetoacetase, putative [Prunus dulcis]